MVLLPRVSNAILTSTLSEILRVGTADVVVSSDVLVALNALIVLGILVALLLVSGPAV